MPWTVLGLMKDGMFYNLTHYQEVPNYSMFSFLKAPQTYNQRIRSYSLAVPALAKRQNNIPRRLTVDIPKYHVEKLNSTKKNQMTTAPLLRYDEEAGDIYFDYNHWLILILKETKFLNFSATPQTRA